MKRASAFLVALILALAAACASIDNAKKLERLQPGMTRDQVVATLGVEPKSERAAGDATVLRFDLHDFQRGVAPYDLTFDGSGRLVEWGLNEEEYRHAQETAAALFGQSPSSGDGAAGGRAVASGPNDPELQRFFAGRYMSYTGQTYRVCVLGASGRFQYSRESSYSGHEDEVGGVWGAATQSGDSGAWTISGTRSAGVLHLIYDSGQTADLQYRVGNEAGVLILDGITFAYEAPAD